MTAFAATNNFCDYTTGCFYDIALEEARAMSREGTVCAPCGASLKAILTDCNRF